MFNSEQTRCHYGASQLMEVLCQLRFPTILKIGAAEPVDLQETIRQDYPRYAVQEEHPAPKVTGLGTANPQIENQPPVINYCFAAADGAWRVNLTNRFITLSTQRYPRWEDFAARLDRLLAAFIPVYQPTFFERIGLRYVNAFSRKALGLEGTPWNELLQPAYLGMLAEEDVSEQAVSKSAMDVDMALRHGCRMKLHAGPGTIRKNGKPEPEPRFILDLDLSMSGQLHGPEITGALNTLHGEATSVFRGAITEKLHQAMEPEF